MCVKCRQFGDYQGRANKFAKDNEASGLYER